MAYISFQPQDYFNTKLYTGNSTDNNAQTGIGFSPSWVWIKGRSNAGYNHNIYDAVRGATKYLRPNSTGAEVTDALTLKSFDSDGFTLGTDATNNEVNDSGINYVAWNWKANGQGSANTDGTINTTYTSANTTSGFSIVTYTGTGSNATIGHGLGVKPSMIICKRLNSTGGWISYHSALGATKYLYLDNTDAEATNSTVWQDTEPTTSVFSVGTASNCNASGGTYVAYCFAEKQGYSKFGSYTGNGSTDGSFIYTGFAPAFIITKITSGVDSWFMYDNKRSPFNVRGKYLVADGNGTDSNADAYDFLSNGFKVKSTATSFNGNGSTYIYMAFAEAPLVSSNGVPATAR